MKQALTVPQCDETFKKFLQLCGRAGLLPDSHIISDKFIQKTGHPVAHVGFGNVWEGVYNGERVAIKALRIHKGDDTQKFRKVTRQHFFTSRWHLQLTLISRPFVRRLRCGNASHIPISSRSSEFWRPLLPFPWYQSGCQTEMCENTLSKNQRSADYNWCVTERMGYTLVDNSLVTRHHSRFIVFALPRYRSWRFERSMHPLLAFIRLDLTTSHFRIIYSLTSWAVRGSTGLG
jgi:hypothetical protein